MGAGMLWVIIGNAYCLILYSVDHMRGSLCHEIGHMLEFSVKIEVDDICDA